MLVDRVANESVRLFEAMDSIDDAVHECYAAIFDPKTGDWSQQVDGLFEDGLINRDVLFIAKLELDQPHRGKGIGAKVVRETLATFGSHCGLVACKPFPLQHNNWEDEAKKEVREAPGYEQRRMKDFARVAEFWAGCGFVKLPESDFYVYSP